jgi:S-adenosyl methyltransferase
VPDEWLRKATRPVRIARVDATAPNVARVWNYLVGGRDNFEADRAVVREVTALAPVVADVAPASQAFLPRVVRFLAAEAAIRQLGGGFVARRPVPGGAGHRRDSPVAS